MERFIGILGILVLLAIAVAMSNNRKSIPWTAEAMSQYDAAIIATAHSVVKHVELSNWIPCIVDTRNAMASREAIGATLTKA
jgi:UDP-N-acetyl-D-mannosaminuronate dehydrogenase